MIDIIKMDVEQVQESLVHRNDVYNSKRVIIRAEKWRGVLYVYIKGFQAMEFSFNADPLEVANYIQEYTLKAHS